MINHERDWHVGNTQCHQYHHHLHNYFLYISRWASFRNPHHLTYLFLNSTVLCYCLCSTFPVLCECSCPFLIIILDQLAEIWYHRSTLQTCLGFLSLKSHSYFWFPLEPHFHIQSRANASNSISTLSPPFPNTGVTHPPKFIQALITSHLDSCRSSWTGLPDFSLFRLMSLLHSCHIHLFIQGVFIENLLHARHCSNHWGHSS